MKAGVSEGRKFWGRRQGFSQRWMGGLGAASLVEHLRVFQHHAHLCMSPKGNLCTRCMSSVGNLRTPYVVHRKPFLPTTLGDNHLASQDILIPPLTTA